MILVIGNIIALDNVPLESMYLMVSASVELLSFIKSNEGQLLMTQKGSLGFITTDTIIPHSPKH
jgi:hypothetical protein